MKKIISLLLVLVMTFTASFAAFANTDSMPSNSATTYNNVLEEINGEKISKVDNIEYYMDYTDDYNIVIGKLSSGMLDVSYYDKVNGIVYNGLLKNKYTKIAEDEFYISIKTDILNGKLKLEIIDQSISISRTVSSNSEHEDFIWNKLQELGWDEPGISLYMTEIRNGDEGKIELATAYSYNEKTNIYSAVAGTTVSVIAAIFGLDIESVMSIGVFTYSLVKEAYVLFKDEDFIEYNVYAYEDKYVSVNNEYQYRAGRTVKWGAVCSDKGALLSDNVINDYDYDYYDNDALMDTGFDNYYNY